MKKQADIIPFILIAILAAALAASTFHKALTSSFTHDESFTYNHYVTAPLQEVFDYKVISPNNHLLNTLLMKLFSMVAGSSAIVLRMPNILAHLGFLLFTFLLLRRINPWLLLSLFAMVNCNPYMLDMFALARGNGLSYFFMVGSLWYFIDFIRRKEIKRYIAAILLALFGVLSHFALLYFFAALMIVANLWLWLEWYFSGEKRFTLLRNSIKINVVNLISGLALIAIMAGPIFKMMNAGQFFYGGEQGFWHDTVGTLIETFFYGSRYGSIFPLMLQILIVAVVSATFLLFVFVFVRHNRELFTGNSELFLIFFLLIVAISINASQFQLTGTKLLIRRYGLFYAPLFLLCFAFLVNLIMQIKKAGFVMGALTGLMAIAFTFHTFRSFSSDTYLDWDYERDTKKVMEILKEDVQKTGFQGNVTIGITWLFEPTMNFYRQTDRLNWLNPLTREGPATKADYYYVMRDDLKSIPVNTIRPVILFDNGKTILIRHP